MLVNFERIKTTNTMKSIIELHKEHQEWLSEIDFMIREIDFFTSIATKYESEINDLSFIESFEAYQSSFLVILDKLKKHKVAIEFAELRFREAIQIKSVDPELASMTDPVHQRLHIDNLIRQVKVLKESLFDLVLRTKRKQIKEDLY